MTPDPALYRLLAWMSPAYPTGAFSYSHGLEWAVEAGTVTGLPALIDYIDAVLSRGGGWVDAVLFTHAWRAARRDDLVALDEIADLASAFRGSSETALESRQQGAAFLEVTRKAWPHPMLEAFAARRTRVGSDNRSLPSATRCVPTSASVAATGTLAVGPSATQTPMACSPRQVAPSPTVPPTPHSIAVSLACASHDIDLEPALHAYLHAVASNLVSAGARLIPLGQTQAQIAIARLAPVINSVAARALTTDLDDVGTAAPAIELCSLLHETQYTRLFRS